MVYVAASLPEGWEDHICALVQGIGEAFGEEMHARLEQKGFGDIPYAHGRNVMRNLDYGGTRLTLIAERAKMTKQAIGELVDQLVALGYVERLPDPVDGRAKLIAPTARGRAAKDAARECLQEIDAEWTQRIGDARMDELRRALKELQEPSAAAAALASGGRRAAG